MPFLVLAVGVDNIFILVHAFEKDPRSKKEPFGKYVGRILGKVGPSILLTGVSESGCFFLGKFVYIIFDRPTELDDKRNFFRPQFLLAGYKKFFLVFGLEN